MRVQEEWGRRERTLNSIVPDLSSSNTCGMSHSSHETCLPLCGSIGPRYDWKITHIEDVVCKLPGITEWEELPVDLLELCTASSVGHTSDGADHHLPSLLSSPEGQSFRNPLYCRISL